MHKDRFFSSYSHVTQNEWERIFGPRVAEKSIVRSRKAAVNAPMVMGDIKPFISPVDKTLISSRSQLREHEKKHGVRQIGNDWSGRERPSCWEQRADIVRNGSWERPRSSDD